MSRHALKIAASAAALLTLAATPASALEACFTDSVGEWQGESTNWGVIQAMDTEFSIDAAGGLTGRYHVKDKPPFDGTLTGFHQTGPCEADFVWKDPAGVGVTHIHFEPEQDRFLGSWGNRVVVPGQLFNGYRRPLS